MKFVLVFFETGNSGSQNVLFLLSFIYLSLETPPAPSSHLLGTMQVVQRFPFHVLISTEIETLSLPLQANLVETSA